MQDIKEMRVER